MFHDNIFLQTCAVGGLLLTIAMIVSTFTNLPGVRITEQNGDMLGVRIVLLMILFGLMRGAF